MYQFNTPAFRAKSLLGLLLSTAMMASVSMVAATPALANSGNPAHPANSADSQWEMSTSDPFNGKYYPTYTGNGYFTARVPAQGRGFSSANVQTSFQIQGFYTSGSAGNQWRVGGPAWTGLNVSDGSSSFNDAFKTPCAFGEYCQIEDARLEGGLSIGQDHGGYQGTGFVQGFGSETAKALLTVPGVTKSGDYDLILRYAAGNPGDNTNHNRVVSIDIGGSSQTMALKPTADGNWDSWQTARVTVHVPDNAVALGGVQIGIAGLGDGSDPAKDSRVNIDAAALVVTGAEPADAPATTTLEDHHLSNYRQMLNMRTGTITTSSRWETPAGNVLDVSYAVTPSRANDQLGLVSLTVTPITWRNADDGLTVTDSLDTRAASNATFEKSTDASARQIALTTTLDGTGQRATYVSQLEGTGTLTQTGLDGNDTIEQSLRTAVEQGKSYTFTKFVGLATNQDTGNTTAETRAAAAAVARKAASLGRNAVQSSSDAAWAEL